MVGLALISLFYEAVVEEYNNDDEHDYEINHHPFEVAISDNNLPDKYSPKAHQG